MEVVCSRAIICLKLWLRERGGYPCFQQHTWLWDKRDWGVELNITYAVSPSIMCDYHTAVEDEGGDGKDVSQRLYLMRTSVFSSMILNKAFLFQITFPFPFSTRQEKSHPFVKLQKI